MKKLFDILCNILGMIGTIIAWAFNIFALLFLVCIILAFMYFMIKVIFVLLAEILFKILPF